MPSTVEDRRREILDSIVTIEELLQGADLSRFDTDRTLRLAIERLRFVNHREGSQTKTEPNIDWRNMIDFCNLLRHAYHATNVNIVWDIIQNHLQC